jgi:hypothetical protein
LVLLVVTAACDSGNSSTKPYLEFAGGGFIFNYRLATADYGFVARVLRAIPEGSIIEAAFDDPAGGPPIVLRQSAAAKRISYVFRTPPVQGVRAGHDYGVVLRVLAPDGRALARYEKRFRAEVDQSVLPDAPPVVGPGYQRAPPSQ